MTEVSSNNGAQGPENGGKGLGRMVWLALAAVAAVAVLAVLYVILSPANKADGLAGLNRGEMEKLTIAAPAKPAPTAPFVDASGKTLTVADFKGQVAVVNLWATWCGPCKVEMPTLAKLQAAFAGQPVQVVTISVDRPDDADKARAFIAEHAPLKFYHDPQYALAFAVDPRVEGLPTTIIYGKDGKEHARLAGDADWSSGDARRVIERLAAQ